MNDVRRSAGPTNMSVDDVPSGRVSFAARDNRRFASRGLAHVPEHRPLKLFARRSAAQRKGEGTLVRGGMTARLSAPGRALRAEVCSLNLHLHYHTVQVDSVFVKEADGVRYIETPPPSKVELDDVVRCVHARASAWLRRHGYLDERSAEGNVAAEPTAIDCFAALALAGRTFLGRPASAEPRKQDDVFAKKERRFSASYQGFDLHRAVRVERDDDEGRE